MSQPNGNQPQQMTVLAWKAQSRLVQGGGRIVDIQLQAAVAGGGLLIFNLPPLPADSAKEFANEILTQATGLVLP